MYSVDPEHGDGLSRAHVPLVALSPLLLEDDDLLGEGLLFHSHEDPRVVQEGSAEQCELLTGHQHNLVETDLGPDIVVQFLHHEHIVFDYLVL